MTMSLRRQSIVILGYCYVQMIISRQMPVKSILVYSVVYIYSHYTWSSISSAKGPKTRVYFGVESFIDNYIDREKAYKPGY